MAVPEKLVIGNDIIHVWYDWKKQTDYANMGGMDFGLTNESCLVRGRDCASGGGVAVGGWSSPHTCMWATVGRVSVHALCAFVGVLTYVVWEGLVQLEKQTLNHDLEQQNIASKSASLYVCFVSLLSMCADTLAPGGVRSSTSWEQ